MPVRTKGHPTVKCDSTTAVLKKSAVYGIHLRVQARAFFMRKSHPGGIHQTCYPATVCCEKVAIQRGKIPVNSRIIVSNLVGTDVEQTHAKAPCHLERSTYHQKSGHDEKMLAQPGKQYYVLP